MSDPCEASEVNPVWRVTVYAVDPHWGSEVEKKVYERQSRGEALALRRQIAAVLVYNAACGVRGRVTMRKVR